jgi:hypothetical protein
MGKLRRSSPVAIALILAFLLSSCGVLYKTRIIVRHGKAVSGSNAPVLLSATREDLETKLAAMYAAIQSFQATVDLTPSVGSVYKGQITEIKDVRAFVLFRKPADIRIIGQTPVVRTTAFDMVSNGLNFKFFLSARNLFVEGANDAPANSKNKIENLRPEAFLSSMLVRPADPATEATALTDQTDEENALYILWFIRKRPDGTLDRSIARSIWFDRLDLSIARQIAYAPDGNIVSDTRYSKWQPYSGALFPAHIDINRPGEGYGVVLDVTDMQMNKPMTDDKFVLARPAGAQLQEIGAARPPESGPARIEH